ncbi:MAG: hypothetical protein IT379_38690 [Deltaproteobacteria bacterium]|nr:hypothetical protein [Deltaproteobacteria bacterium]
MIAAIVVATVLCMLVVLLLREGWLGYPPRRIPGSVLTRKEEAFLVACEEAFFPSGGPLPSGRDAGIVHYFERMVAELPRRQRFLIRLLFVFVEHGGLLFGPIRSRITRQSRDERVRTFRDWELSSIYFRRTAFLSLRTLMTMAYFDAPAVSARVMSPDCAYAQPRLAS